MNFNGFNQNNSDSDGRPSRKLFTFGASQNNSTPAAGFNQVPNGNANPGISGFGNQSRPIGQNPGFGQTSPNLVSFGSNSNNSLSSQSPQKMNFNFTNRSDSGRVVFKANAGTSTFRPPALVNSVRPRPMAQNSLGGMKFNLTWDPKATPEQPVFPSNGMGLASSSDHVLSNQRRRDNAFSSDNPNIRSLSCLTDMTPRPTTFNTNVPLSGLGTNVLSTLSNSSALQNNTASSSPSPSIFTKSLLSQPPEARKNIFNFSKPSTASEVPKAATSSELSLVPAPSTEKETTPVNVSVSKPFEVPKLSLPTSVSEPTSKKSLVETGQNLSTSTLPSVPAFGKAEIKSTPSLFSSPAFQAAHAQITKPSVFNIANAKEGSSLSGDMFGFNSAKIVPNSEAKSSKPVNVTPSIPSLFNLSKFKTNAPHKPNDEDKNKVSSAKLFQNPFLTKKSFSEFSSKNNFSMNSLSKRPFDNFDTSISSKKNSSGKSITSASKELVIGDKTSKTDSISSTSLSFNSNLSTPDFRALSNPTSTLNTKQSFNSASYFSPEQLDKLNNSLISYIKNSMAKNPFKSLDEIITLALNDKDKLLLNSSESKEISGGLKSQVKSFDYGIPEKPAANNKEIDSKTTEISSTNKSGKFNFSFDNSSKSIPVPLTSNLASPPTTSSPPRTKAFSSLNFSNQSDPKSASSNSNNKLASSTSNTPNNNGFQPTTQFSFGTQTSLTSNSSGIAGSGKAIEASLTNTKASDNSFKAPTVTLKPNVPLFSFASSQPTNTLSTSSNSLPFSPRSDTSSASDKDVGTMSHSNNKINLTTAVSKPVGFSNQSNLTVTPFQSNSNPVTSGPSLGSLSNNSFSPKPLFSFRSADSPVFSPKPHSPDSSKSNLSFGTTKTAPISFSLSNPGSSDFKVPSQINTINSLTEASTINFKPFTSNSVTPSQPSLKFGLASSKTTEANPLSKFGLSNNSASSSQSNLKSDVSQEPASTSQPIFKFGVSDKSKSATQPVFKFGLSDDSNSVSQSNLKSTILENTTPITQSDSKIGNSTAPSSSFKLGSTDSGISTPKLTFKPTSPDAAKSPSPLSFKFGSSGKDSVAQIGLEADMPNPSGSTPTDKLILGAGGSKAQPSFKFGSSDKSNVPQLGLNFGLSGTSGAVSNSNKISSTDTKTQPIFKFGSSDKSSVPQLGFNFGLSGTSNIVSKNDTSSSTDTQTQPIFKFVSPSAESSTSQKAFTLGSTDNSKSAPSPIFKFGSNVSSKPVFTFESSVIGSSSTPSFKIGTDPDFKSDKDDSESNPSKPLFKFGFSGSNFATTTPTSSASESTGSTPISFFPKEQAPITAPKLNLSFGLANSNSNSTSFKFSLPNSTSVNESSAAETKSDSETDPAEEGFSGARTNDALIVRGQGEEEETSLIQLTIKLLAYDITKKSYTDMGVGILKVNQHESTKKQRVVCRAEGSGRLLLNANLPAQSAEVIPKPRGVRLRINNLEGIPSMFIIRIRTDAEVEQFIDVLEGSNKP